MNEQLKLGMTPEQVKDILGSLDDIKKDSWGAITFCYTEYNKQRRIRFVDGLVIHIQTWGTEKAK